MTTPSVRLELCPDSTWANLVDEHKQFVDANP
jgi:hypothetical protein